MNKKLLITLAVSLLVFCLLIFFNYYLSQKQLSQPKSSLMSINLLNPPSQALAGQPVEFVWQLQAPDTSFTSNTTIYYSFISSPSALTQTDSPQAVDYSYSFPDYLNGQFALPDTFKVKEHFLPGTVYYRAYAQVGKDHLWTKEFELTIK